MVESMYSGRWPAKMSQGVRVRSTRASAALIQSCCADPGPNGCSVEWWMKWTGPKEYSNLCVGTGGVQGTLW